MDGWRDIICCCSCCCWVFLLAFGGDGKWSNARKCYFFNASDMKRLPKFLLFWNANHFRYFLFLFVFHFMFCYIYLSWFKWDLKRKWSYFAGLAWIVFFLHILDMTGCFRVFKLKPADKINSFPTTWKLQIYTFFISFSGILGGLALNILYDIVHYQHNPDTCF